MKLKETFEAKGKRLGDLRLLKLARFLREKLNDKLFDFKAVVKIPRGARPPKEAYKAGGGCGTVACAIGWSPMVFPRDLEYVGSTTQTFDGEEFFTFKGVRVKGTSSSGYFFSPVLMDFFGLDEEEYCHLFVPSDVYSNSTCPLGSGATAKQVAANIERFVKERSTKRPGR